MDCRIDVFYDPVNPAVHTLVVPQKLYEEERGYYIPAWLWVPFLFVLLNVIHVLKAKFEGRRGQAKS